jgi:hypothetical protein
MNCRIVTGIILYLSMNSLMAQTNNELRLNILNPGVAWEHPLGKHTTLEFNAGIGYNYSYPELNTEYEEGGFQWQIATFVDVQGRNYYNLEKREGKGKKSGNFLALRYLYYGPRIAGNVRPNENYTMAVGPTWGIKRRYGKWTMLSSVGPVYYFDLTGTGGILPINLEFNLGYRLK